MRNIKQQCMDEKKNVIFVMQPANSCALHTKTHNGTVHEE